MPICDPRRCRRLREKPYRAALSFEPAHGRSTFRHAWTSQAPSPNKTGMNGIFLRVAETENLMVQVPPAEKRAFIAAARAVGGAAHLRQALNEEEVRVVRAAGAAGGLKVAEIRATLRGVRCRHGSGRLTIARRRR